MDAIESKDRLDKEKHKIRTEQLFVLADAISSRISYILTKPEDRSDSDILHPWNYYPKMFAKEKKMAELSEEEIELERYKEKRRQHAAEYNRRRQEAGL